MAGSDSPLLEELVLLPSARRYRLSRAESNGFKCSHAASDKKNALNLLLNLNSTAHCFIIATI